MKENQLLKTKQVLFPLLIFVMLIAAGFCFVSPAAAQNGTDEGTEVVEDTTSNEACLSCHKDATNPWELPNGDLLPLQVDPDVFANSSHGRSDVVCIDCHVDYDGYPHPELDVLSAKDYEFKYLATCAECHEDQATATQDSIHGKLFAAGYENAPTCMDCHNPHTQVFVSEVSRASFTQVCAQCHSGIYEEYANSVHGESLLIEGNQDVPGCAECHGVHYIDDPRTAEFRNSSVYMCSDCHTDEAIMGKYGLSTDVLDTYVADFHGTTVTIFDKTEPGQVTNKAVCYDCHGVHEILSVNDPEKGLSVKENMLVSCQKCHPDATENFSDSWLSHYRPDKEKFPIVYYVDLFYKFLLPTVLGGMAIFVLSDVYRRVRMLFKKPAVKAAADEKEANDE